MTFVARTKTDRQKLVDNRQAGAAKAQVTLTCFHSVAGYPALSNPDRWWCCGGWRTKR